MYHVVIIDDEPIIVEGISKLVPWEKSKNCMKSSRVRLTSLSYSVIIMENKKWILEEFNSILWEEYRL